MASAKAAATSGATQPAALPDAQSDVKQPAGIISENTRSKGVTSLHLSELNTRSAKLGGWDVGIHQPRIDDWQWKDKNNQETKHGAAFRCHLVSSLNPSEYVVAQQNMRNGNKNHAKKLSSVSKKTPLFA